MLCRLKARERVGRPIPEPLSPAAEPTLFERHENNVISLAELVRYSCGKKFTLPTVADLRLLRAPPIFVIEEPVEVPRPFLKVLDESITEKIKTEVVAIACSDRPPSVGDAEFNLHAHDA